MRQIDREKFLQDISEAINRWEEDRLIELVSEGLAAGFSPLEIVQDALFPPLKKACRELETHDVTFPELVLIVHTIKPAMALLLPRIRASLLKGQARGKVVIGTVKGDIHDLGKNLVVAVFESGGYDVMDLGRDVPINEFVRAAEEQKADVVAASTLMTPTLHSMEELITEVRARKLKVKTIIGGWATSPEFAQKIGADAWAKDALEGLHKLDKLVSR
jgi:5-methyltetrahydrofolate--homocysteine methyltransferase